MEVKMYCPKCGVKNQDSAVFCIKCGNRIIEETIESSNNLELNATTKEANNLKFKTDNIKIPSNQNCNTKAKIKKASSEKIGENYESTLRAYVGKNSDYYISQFKNIETNKKANVNWTWLIGGFWLLYRKMYAYFFLTLIPIANIFFLMNLIVNSNKIYYKFICKKVEMDGMMGKDIEHHEDNISLAKKHGGISYVGIVVSLVISILIPLALYISIMAYISSLNNDEFYSYNDLTGFEYGGIVEDNVEDDMSFNILYNYVSIAELFTFSIDKVDGWLGERSFDGYYAGGRTYGYNNDEIHFAFDENTREIIAIFSSASALSVNEQTLNKNQAEITRILGIASYEGWSEEGMGEDHYYMSYNFNTCSFSISLPQYDEDAYGISIFKNN